MGVGLVLMVIVASSTPPDPSVTPLGYGFGVILLIGVLLIGVESKGAQRWLEIPGLPKFQPSELVKILVPMMIALWVSQHRLPVRIPVVLVGLIFVVIPVGLIARQPDQDPLLVAASGIFVILLAGIQWR